MVAKIVSIQSYSDIKNKRNINSNRVGNNVQNNQEGVDEILSDYGIDQDAQKQYLESCYREIIGGYFSDLSPEIIDDISYKDITYSNNMMFMNVYLSEKDVTRSIPVNFLTYEDRAVLGLIM